MTMWNHWPAYSINVETWEAFDLFVVGVANLPKPCESSDEAKQAYLDLKARLNPTASLVKPVSPSNAIGGGGGGGGTKPGFIFVRVNPTIEIQQSNASPSTGVAGLRPVAASGFSKSWFDNRRTALELSFNSDRSHVQSYEMYEEYVENLLNYYYATDGCSGDGIGDRNITGSNNKNNDVANLVKLGNPSAYYEEKDEEEEEEKQPKGVRGSWRSFSWGSASSPLLEFEICMAMYCRATYRFGSVKKWIQRTHQSLLLDTDWLLFERLNHAYDLKTSESAANKAKIDDPSYSYYSRPSAPKDGRTTMYDDGERDRQQTRIGFTEDDKDDIKKNIVALQEASATFIHLARRRFPSEDWAYFNVDDKRLQLVREDSIDVLSPPVETYAWAEEFVGTCDVANCLRLYAHCALTAAFLVHVLLSDAYRTHELKSPPSRERADNRLADAKKSKALLDHAYITLLHAKNMPIRMISWENRLNTLCVMCYARYKFDSAFRNPIKPSIETHATPYKALYAVLKVLTDAKSVYRTYRGGGHRPQKAEEEEEDSEEDDDDDTDVDGGKIGRWERPLRLLTVLRSVGNYYERIVPMPFYNPNVYPQTNGRAMEDFVDTEIRNLYKKGSEQPGGGPANLSAGANVFTQILNSQVAKTGRVRLLSIPTPPNYPELLKTALAATTITGVVPANAHRLHADDVNVCALIRSLGVYSLLKTPTLPPEGWEAFVDPAFLKKVLESTGEKNANDLYYNVLVGAAKNVATKASAGTF